MTKAKALSLFVINGVIVVTVLWSLSVAARALAIDEDVVRAIMAGSLGILVSSLVIATQVEPLVREHGLWSKLFDVPKVAGPGWPVINVAWIIFGAGVMYGLRRGVGLALAVGAIMIIVAFHFGVRRRVRSLDRAAHGRHQNLGGD